MKIEIDGQEYDIDLHGVADVLIGCSAQMSGIDVPDFVDRTKQIEATSFAFAAIILYSEEAEQLLQTIAGHMGEEQLERNLKRFGS